MKKRKLKLYVWTNFSPDYSGGLAFAIASSEGSARKLVEKSRGFEVYDWGDLKTYPLSRPFAHSVCGGG